MVFKIKMTLLIPCGGGEWEVFILKILDYLFHEQNDTSEKNTIAFKLLKNSIGKHI